jgi:hypothetical protein
MVRGCDAWQYKILLDVLLEKAIQNFIPTTEMLPGQNLLLLFVFWDHSLRSMRK